MPTAAAMEELRIGHVASVQVPRREVRIVPETDVPDRFATLTVARFRAIDGALHEWPVVDWRRAGAKVVLLLDGPDDAAMAALRRADVVIPADQRGALPEDMFFPGDVIGAVVTDPDGARLGEVTGVAGSPAQAVLEVLGDNGKHYAIACVSAHVLELDEAAGRVTVDPAFLLDESGRAY